MLFRSFQATAGANKINEDSKRDLRIRTEYIENYKSNIQNIVDRAEKLKKQRLFSNPESFSYKNIIKTGKDYEKLININLSADNSKLFPYTTLFRSIKVFDLYRNIGNFDAASYE